MKKISIPFILFFLGSYFAQSQSLGYVDLGILFSKEDFRGTARYNAMGGAFGALGGDVSASYTNPASNAVFNKSEFSFSMLENSTNTNANYYGTNTRSENTNIRIPQFGAAFVFENVNYGSLWTKFAIGVNYNITNNFKNTYKARGSNSANFATYIEHPNDTQNPKSQYTSAQLQTFTNAMNGRSDVYSFSFSAAHEDNFYVGASINAHRIEFTQDTFLTEENRDPDTNDILQANQSLYISEFNNGISFGIGIIGKTDYNFRYGLSYQSPVWYNDSIEETNITETDGFEGDTRISSGNVSDNFSNVRFNRQFTNLRYSLRTPNKFTASAAYVFNTFGLISIDYAYNFYNRLELGNGNFSFENDEFNSILKKETNTLRIGTEWKVKNISLRGGYFLSENPFNDTIDNLNKKEPLFGLGEYIKIPNDNRNTTGYSLGIGTRYKNTRFDISYENSNRTEFYDFYSQYNEIDAATLDIDNTKITASLTFSF